MSGYLAAKSKLTANAFTHVGMKRDHNEDAYLVSPDYHLYLVADGMGGHNSGEIASRMAVETVDNFFRATLNDDDITWPFKYDPALSDVENRLKVSIRLANGHIWNASRRNELYHGMGTTLVGACFWEESGVIVNVGDSRAYRFRDGELWQLSTDHSLLNEQLKTVRMSAAEIEAFPHKNVIMRALGIREDVEVDLIPYTPERGDFILLCSDGLSDMVPDDVIRDLFAQHKEEARLLPKFLVREANARGGNDNVTALVIGVD